MDLDFELKGSMVVNSNVAQVVYANRHESHLHLVLRDKLGNLYPTRYNLWDVSEDIRVLELGKLQYLVDALRIPVLKNTNQLIGDDYIAFSMKRESGNVLWFTNPCLPDAIRTSSESLPVDKPAFDVEVVAHTESEKQQGDTEQHQPQNIPVPAYDDDDLPPPPRSPVAPTAIDTVESSMPPVDIQRSTGATGSEPDLSSVSWDAVIDD
jgi:hypothetical protein